MITAATTCLNIKISGIGGEVTATFSDSGTVQRERQREKVVK